LDVAGAIKSERKDTGRSPERAHGTVKEATSVSQKKREEREDGGKLEGLEKGEGKLVKTTSEEK